MDLRLSLRFSTYRLTPETSAQRPGRDDMKVILDRIRPVLLAGAAWGDRFSAQFSQLESVAVQF